MDEISLEETGGDIRSLIRERSKRYLTYWFLGRWVEKSIRKYLGFTEIMDEISLEETGGDIRSLIQVD